MAFNYRLQYWEARFPNNCTGSINISSAAAAAPAYTLTTHTNSFCTSAPLPLQSPFVAHFLVPLIIIAWIGEAEIGMGKKRTLSKEESAGLTENDCNVMHFSRNPCQSLREHQVHVFTNPVLFILFSIFRLFRQYLRGNIPRNPT